MFCGGRQLGDPCSEAASAPPLGELLSEREAEGVRYEILVNCKIRTTPSQSAHSGCQLSQRESQGRFAPPHSASTRHSPDGSIHQLRADAIRPYRVHPVMPHCAKTCSTIFSFSRIFKCWGHFASHLPQFRQLSDSFPPFSRYFSISFWAWSFRSYT